MVRLHALCVAVFTLAAAVIAQPLSAEVKATDILGREVALPEPARRIVLGEGRHMAVLGLLLLAQHAASVREEDFADAEAGEEAKPARRAPAKKAAKKGDDAQA